MATVRLTASQMTMVPEIVTGEVLLVMLTVMARVGVSEGVTLTQCVGGCLHIQDGTMNNVTCEGFPVNGTVLWEIVYQGQSLFYGTCGPSVDPGPCTSHNNGFTLSVEQPGNVSVLTIDLENFQRNLTDHEVICISDGKRADCTISYSACPPTTPNPTTPTNFLETTSDTQTNSTAGVSIRSVPDDLPVAAIAGGAGALVVIVVIIVVVVSICKRRRSGNRKASEPFVECKNQEIAEANDPSEDDVENVQDMNGLYAVVDENKKINNKTKHSRGTNGRTGLVQPSSNNATGRESHMYVNDSVLVKASNSQEPDSAGEATDTDQMYSIVEKPWKAKPMAAVKPVQTAKASTLPNNLSTSNPSRQDQHTEDEYNSLSFTERRSVPGAVHHDYSHIGHASPMNLSVPDLQSQQTDGQYNTLGYTEQRSAPDGLQADYSHIGQAFPVSRSTSDLQQPDTDDQYNTPSG
ncbi:hypothetical protein BaRGS_00039153 [Batillaria attramentaria]|uniref:Uncharacterized protein n=1 Tax=Batillaria attramentaria TaxID=370345 RepID=A0ABD0J3U9_9CAEN